MFDETSHIKSELRLYAMGKRFRAGFAKQHPVSPPVGDRMINAVRGVIWEAWEMGLDKGGSSYPSAPLLDQLTQPGQKPNEPQEPTRQIGLVKPAKRKNLGEPVEPVEPPWEPEP